MTPVAVALLAVAGVHHSSSVGVVGGDGLSSHHHRHHRHHSRQEDRQLSRLPFLRLLFSFSSSLLLLSSSFRLRIPYSITWSSSSFISSGFSSPLLRFCFFISSIP